MKNIWNQLTLLRRKKIILIAICLILVGITAFFITTALPRPVLLPLLHWEHAPGLIAISEPSPASRLSIFRLQDGAEEPLAGHWNTRFINSDAVYIFGSFLGGDAAPSSTFNQSRLFLLTPRGSTILDPKNLPPIISAVNPNRLNTYALIVGATSTSPQTWCIVEITSRAGEPCQDLNREILKNTTSSLFAWWNGVKDHELIIAEQNGLQRQFSYDPWIKKPRLLSNTERFELPPAPPSQELSRNQRWSRDRSFSIVALPFLLIVQNNSTKQKTLLFSHFHPTWYWLSDSELLLLNKHSTSFVNLATRTTSVFPQLPLVTNSRLSAF